MTPPDLTATPFGLDDDGIAWVRSTIDAMSVEEKVGQLFINLNNRFDEAFVNEIIDGYHPGGMRYNHTDAASVQAHIRHAQSRTNGPAAGRLQHRGGRQRRLHRRHPGRRPRCRRRPRRTPTRPG